MPELAPPYWYARPEGPGPFPGVVVVHESNGMSRQILHASERLALEGFAVLAPDLYYTVWPTLPVAAPDLHARVTRDHMVSTIARAADRLRDLGASPVGVVGFCMGGTMTYFAATSGVDVACAVVFYGATIADHLAEPTCPMLGVFAGDDEFIPRREVDAIVARHPGRIAVYDGAPHGFMREGSRSHRPEAASDAWERMLAFLDEHLRPARASRPARA